MISLEEEKIKALIKKVRKWCVIATIIVIVLLVAYTGLKIYLLTNAASSGMGAITSNVASDPEGAGQVLNGFLGLFVTTVSGVAVIALLAIGIVKIIAVVGLIWIGFLIFYLVQRNSLKKLKEGQKEVTN